MSDSHDVDMQSVLNALLDENKRFPPRLLYRFSDIEGEDLALLRRHWVGVPLWRRQALLEDLVELNEADDLLSFEETGRLALKDEDAKVRLYAIQLLGDYELTDLAPVFIRMSEKDEDLAVRAEAAWALGSYIYLGEIEEIPVKLLHQVEECLLRITHTAEEVIMRRRALEALGFSSREEIPALIEAAYQSGQIGLMVSSLFAMGRSANKRYVPQVVPMLDHELPEIRAEAAFAAGELEIRTARFKLLELLVDEDDTVRMRTIWALSQIGGEGVRQALESLQETTEDEDEADFIEQALDNLAFNEDLELFGLMDLEDVDEDIDSEEIFYYPEDTLDTDADEKDEDEDLQD